MSKENKEQKIVVSGVLEAEGKYLIIRRSAKEEFLPGNYEFPGGKVEFGEDATVALKREFREETGIDIEVGNLIRSFNYLSLEGTRHTVEFVYRVKLTEPVDDVVLSDAHDDFCWIEMQEIQQYKTSPEIIKTFEAIGYKIEIELEKLKHDEEITTKEVHIFTDGGSRGNPGPSASGYVIMTPDEKIIDEGGEYLGVTTNNQAEYQAVKLALEAAAKYKPDKIRFFIDSLLVVNQMNGVYKIRNKDLWPIHQKIKELGTNYMDITFTHVRREFNTLADAKVNEVLDSYEHR